MEYHNNKALRLLDKGDLGPGWIEFVRRLNEHGIRVQVFSRRPELLRGISTDNLRLLSVEATSADILDRHRDLSAAFVYQGSADIPVLDRLHQRGQVQVVLPVKLGHRLLSREELQSLKRSLPSVRPYVCPIDAGIKKLPSPDKKKSWNCTQCDKNGGFGCFFGKPTQAVLRSAVFGTNVRTKQQLVIALKEKLHELSTRLDELIGAASAGTGQDVAGTVPRRAGELSRIIQDVRLFLDDVLSVSGVAAERSASERLPDGNRSDPDQAQGGVRVEEGLSVGPPGQRVTNRPASQPDPAGVFYGPQIPLRPGTTLAQKKTGLMAAKAVFYRDISAGARLLASDLWKDWSEGSGSALVGATVRNAHDLATLAQVLRDNRFETVRFFFVRRGRIVHHTAFSSRMPGFVNFGVVPGGRRVYQQAAQSVREMSSYNSRRASASEALMLDIVQQFQQSGADSIWMMHNHPSGRSSPSTADVAFTNVFNMLMSSVGQGSALKGHVVIDQDEYSVISPNHRGPVVPVPITSPRYDAEIPHQVLGTTITNQLSVVRVARALHGDRGRRPGFVTLVSVGARGNVRAAAEFPLGLLTARLADPLARHRVRARLRRFWRHTGASHVGGSDAHFLVAITAKPEDSAELVELVNDGLLIDVVNTQTEQSIYQHAHVVMPVSSRWSYLAGLYGVREPAWHASKQQFDRFRVEYVGSGEGHQAYGWGMYFSESRDLGMYYYRLFREPMEPLFDGVPLRKGLAGADAQQQEATNRYVARVWEEVQRFNAEQHPNATISVRRNEKNLRTLADRVRSRIELYGDQADVLDLEARSILAEVAELHAPEDRARRQYGDDWLTASEAVTILAARLLKSGVVQFRESLPVLYEVDISSAALQKDASLNLDQPLDQQPDVVRKLRGAGPFTDDFRLLPSLVRAAMNGPPSLRFIAMAPTGKLTGQGLYRALESLAEHAPQTMPLEGDQPGSVAEHASRWLLSRGIRTMVYRDPNLERDNPYRNVVVLDPYRDVRVVNQFTGRNADELLSATRVAEPAGPYLPPPQEIGADQVLIEPGVVVPRRNDGPWVSLWEFVRYRNKDVSSSSAEGPSGRVVMTPEAVARAWHAGARWINVQTGQLQTLAQGAMAVQDHEQATEAELTSGQGALPLREVDNLGRPIPPQMAGQDLFGWTTQPQGSRDPQAELQQQEAAMFSLPAPGGSASLPPWRQGDLLTADALRADGRRAVAVLISQYEGGNAGQMSPADLIGRLHALANSGLVFPEGFRAALRTQLSRAEEALRSPAGWNSEVEQDVLAGLQAMIADASGTMVREQQPHWQPDAERDGPRNVHSGGGEYSMREFGLLSDAEQALLEQVMLNFDSAIEKQRGGRQAQSWEATEQAAIERIREQFSVDLDSLLKRRPGSVVNAVQLEEFGIMLATVTKNLMDLARRAARTGSKDDLLALAEMREKLGLLLAPVMGYHTEAGRALNIIAKQKRILDDANAVLEAMGGGSEQVLQDFALRVAAAETPDQVIGLTRASYTPTWWDKFYEYWQNGLLSGLTTHAVNISSNAVFRVLDEVSGALGALMTKDYDTRRVVARFKALSYGTYLGLRNARHYWLHEESSVTPGVVAHEPFQTGKAIGGQAGHWVRTPWRALGAEDEFFKSIAYYAELADIAMGDALRRSPDDPLPVFRQNMANVLNRPEWLSRARDAARHATFQDKLGPLGSQFVALRTRSKFLQLIAPFVRTPVNIIKTALDYTPAGLLRAQTRRLLSGEGHARDVALARGRMSLGTAMMTGAMALAMLGLLTGAGPDDREERAMLQRMGWQPYSVRIGNRYYRYSRLEPLGVIIGLAADMADLIGYFDREDVQRIPSLLVTSIMLNLGDKTFLRGVADFAQFVTDPERYGQQWVASYGASLLPASSLLGQVARTHDPYAREARGVLDAIRERIPLVREKLAKRIDFGGEPIQQTATIGVPVAISPVRDDALTQTMLSLGLTKGRPTRKIQGVTLSDADYEDFAAYIGRVRQIQLTPVVRSPQFKHLMSENPEAARSVLNQLFERTTDHARMAWLWRRPEILAETIRARQTVRQTAVGALP
jgi:hypothetical protein